jgi:acetoin utilization protein AcuB
MGKAQMLVANRMNKNPVIVEPTETLAQAEAKMHSRNFRHLPIVQGRKLVGMLSDHDIRPHQGHLKDTRVTGAMTENPITITPEMAMEDAAEIMLKNKVGGLPVVDKGELVGIVTTTDMLEAFVEILGVTEETTTRIDLLIDAAPPLDLPRASDVIQKCGGEVLGLGTYRDHWEEERVYYLVVRAKPLEAVAEALTKVGFRVLGVH